MKATTLMPETQFLIHVGTFSLPAYTNTENMLAYADRIQHSSSKYSKIGNIVNESLPAGTFDLYEMKEEVNGTLAAIFASISSQTEQLAVPENRIIQIMFDEDPEVQELREALTKKVVFKKEADKEDEVSRVPWTQFVVPIKNGMTTKFYHYCINGSNPKWSLGVAESDYHDIFYGHGRRRFVVENK